MTDPGPGEPIPSVRLDNVEAEYKGIYMWKKKDDAKWLETWTEATQG